MLRNRLPSFATNCIDDWEKKLDAITNETLLEKMTVIGGIPPWVKMYFEKLVSSTGKLIGDVFPSFDLFIYGGVNYTPYKNSFNSLIGKSINSIQLYPASEGFFAYQDCQKDKGLLLLLDHGIYYEFVVAETFFYKNSNY